MSRTFSARRAGFDESRQLDAPTPPKAGPLHQESGGLVTQPSAVLDAHGGRFASGKDWAARGGASALMPRALHMVVVAQPGSVPSRVHPRSEVARSNRASDPTSTDEQVTKSAEHLGIAGRPATAVEGTAGSAPAQPDPIRRAA